MYKDDKWWLIISFSVIFVAVVHARWDISDIGIYVIIAILCALVIYTIGILMVFGSRISVVMADRADAKIKTNTELHTLMKYFTRGIQMCALILLMMIFYVGSISSGFPDNLLRYIYSAVCFALVAVNTIIMSRIFQFVINAVEKEARAIKIENKSA